MKRRSRAGLSARCMYVPTCVLSLLSAECLSVFPCDPLFESRSPGVWECVPRYRIFGDFSTSLHEKPPQPPKRAKSGGRSVNTSRFHIRRQGRLGLCLPRSPLDYSGAVTNLIKIGERGLLSCYRIGSGTGVTWRRY